ncbi:MAG TPA: malonyl-CoA decarboxylase family protein, partial [Candidatus Elarobacter sp.]
RTTPLERAIDALRTLPPGDVAAREPARLLCSGLTVAPDDDLIAILRQLDALDVDAPLLARELQQAQGADDAAARRAAQGRLRRALVPQRNVVLEHMAAPPGDLRCIVALRAALLRLLDERPEIADLAPLDADLRDFLAAHLDVGALQLRRLTWSDSAELLERLARSEAVHAVRGWFDLKDRLDDDRRVYAFFHPALPAMPLVFTEVALTDELPTSIRAILNVDAPRVDVGQARTATFYSISNTERGLTGIPFGNALIKQAVETLRAEMPRLRTFATLSPLPGFAAWVRSLGERVPAEVRTALASAGWQRNPLLVAQVREPVIQLAARYLLAAKRGDGAPQDAVARFHLGNGATVERIDWLGDPTQHGIRQSYGIMVNYRYNLDRYRANQLAYAADYTVDAAPAVRALAQLAPLDETRPATPRDAIATAFERARASATSLLRRFPRRRPAES